MTITQVGKTYELTPDTLRYYERIGLIPEVNRNKSGVRDYTEEDCKWVEFIKCMRSSGLRIEVLIEYVTLFKKGEETLEARKEILIEQRKQLIEKKNAIEETINRLNIKIERYDDLVISSEKNLKKGE